MKHSATAKPRQRGIKMHIGFPEEPAEALAETFAEHPAFAIRTAKVKHAPKLRFKRARMHELLARNELGCTSRRYYG